MTIEINTRTALEQAIEDVRVSNLEVEQAHDDYKRLTIETAEARLRWDHLCGKLEDSKTRLVGEITRPPQGYSEPVRVVPPALLEGVDPEWAANGPVETANDNS